MNVDASQTKPCRYCQATGTVTGSNGSRWRCANCQGTGRVVADPEPADGEEHAF